MFQIIEQTMARIKVKGRFEVGIFGGNFFGIDKETMFRLFESFKPYMDSISNFRISTKPCAVDINIIDLMKHFNVTTIELGIPTFNDMILSILNRGHDANALYTTYNLLKDLGFSVALQVMVGLPYERWNDIERTSSTIAHLSPSYIRIYPLTVLKDTPLYDMYMERRFYPVSLTNAVNRASYIYLSALRNGIPTVKMGLTEGDMVKKGIVAGPYHPAFGYLVKSHVFYHGLASILEKEDITGDILLLLNRRDIPHLLGYRKSNIERLSSLGIKVKWMEKEMKEGEFVVDTGLRTIKGSIFDGIDSLKEG